MSKSEEKIMKLYSMGMSIEELSIIADTTCEEITKIILKHLA